MPKPAKRVAGTITIRRNGEALLVKGSVEYNLGVPKREPVLGLDPENKLHGYKEMPQAAFIRCEATDAGDLDLAELLEGADDTITAELANGKTVVMRNAAQTGEGTVNPEEGSIALEWTGESAEEIAE